MNFSIKTLFLIGVMAIAATKAAKSNAKHHKHHKHHKKGLKQVRGTTRDKHHNADHNADHRDHNRSKLKKHSRMALPSNATGCGGLHSIDLKSSGTVCAPTASTFQYTAITASYYGCLDYPTCPDKGEGGYPGKINGNGPLGGSCGVVDKFTTTGNLPLRRTKDGNLAWTTSEGIVIEGIAAVNYKMLGVNPPTSGTPYGHAGCTWAFEGAGGQGSNVCYKLTTANGKTANVLVYDGCAGYKGQKSCCFEGGPTDCSTDDNCDWCSANNHPHFDLDTTTFGNLVPREQAGNGHFIVEKAEPFICKQ